MGKAYRTRGEIVTNGIVYRMSQAGYCPKRLSAIRLQMEPKEKPAWLERAAEEGNWHEERITQELAQEGVTVTNRQMEVSMNLDSFHIIGHIDGMVSNDNNPETRLLEIKSMSQFEFDRWIKGRFDEFPQYADQLTCYMAATEMPQALYIVKNRNTGYIDKMMVGGYPSDLSAIVEKHQRVEELALKGELHPAEFDPRSYQCRRCEFKDLCLPKPKQLNNIDKNVLLKCVTDRRLAKELEAQAKELKDNADEIFRAYLAEHPEKKFVIGDALIAEVNVKRESYDKGELTKMFGKEALLPALSISEYSYVKMTDFKKAQDND